MVLVGSYYCNFLLAEFYVSHDSQSLFLGTSDNPLEGILSFLQRVLNKSFHVSSIVLQWNGEYKSDLYLPHYALEDFATTSKSDKLIVVETIGK